MEIAITSFSEQEMRFKWKGVNPSLANCLRRTVLAEVPTLAIEDVVVDENESPMSDEQVAHMLGFVPLTTPPDKYVFPEDCENKREDQRCRATLTLDAQAQGGIRMVTSGDLTSDDDEVKPVSTKIPITKLGPGKRLKLEAYAVLGIGKKHAKFQPVSTVYYKFQPLLEIDLERCSECGKCVESCPKGVISIEDSKIVIVNPDECTMCNECIKACPESPPAVKISHSQDTAIFTIESTGAIPSDRILEEALAIMKERFNNVKEKLMQGEAAIG